MRMARYGSLQAGKIQMSCSQVLLCKLGFPPSYIVEDSRSGCETLLDLQEQRAAVARRRGCKG